MTPHDTISKILIEMGEMVKPGISTMEINDYAEKRVLELGYTSYNKGYKHATATEPYPFATCINIDNVIAHGKPSNYRLQNGDLVSLDLGIKSPEGLCADAGYSLGCGEISNRKQRLLYYAKKTTYEVISHLKPGRSTEDIAKICEYYAANMGYRVNLRFAGHRIAEQMHMKPNIYSGIAPHNSYAKLEVGQVYCIEPMLTPGKDAWGVMTDPDGWTYVTNDGQPSAFFEHMVKITGSGAKVLTTHFDKDPIKSL